MRKWCLLTKEKGEDKIKDIMRRLRGLDIKIRTQIWKVCYYEPHFIVYRQQRTGVSAHVYDSGAFGLSDFRTGADLKGTGLETDYLDRHSLRGKCPGCDHYAVLLLFHRNFYGTDLGNFSVQS